MMPWVAENLGKTIYVMASDYAWPQKMTEAISAAYDKVGGKIVGADYYPFGTTDFGPAFQKIRDLKPDVVWSMVVGNDAVTQLKQYRSFDVKQPLIAPLDEVFNKDALPAGVAGGTYAPQPYWMALDNPANKKFISSFREKFGQDKMVNGIARQATTACTSTRSRPPRPTPSRTTRCSLRCRPSSSTRRRAR